MRAFARVAALLLIVLLALALAGTTIAANNERIERGQYPAPGTLVDVGGGQLIHLRAWGTRNGNDPAIILNSSAGMPSSEWSWISPLLGEHHLVIAYDRPGIAWSAGPAAPRDAMSAADALDRALASAGIAPPYVVVGHSFGGLSARAFAGTHLDSVRGLVLLDTTDADAGGLGGSVANYQMSAWRADFGLDALGGATNDFPTLPAAEQAAASAVSKWPSSLDTTVDELRNAANSADEIRPLDLTNMPLLVVAIPDSPQHVALQRHLASLSSRSTYVEQDGYHMGMLIEQDQAVQTAQKIETFVDGLANGRGD